MEKFAGTREHRVFLELLRETRKSAGVTQVELAQRIDETQSYVSKFERGELRLDFLQLRTVCQALGTSIPDFSNAFEQRLGDSR